MKKGFLTKKKTNKKSRSMPHLRTGGGNNGRRRPFATGRSKHNNNGMNYNMRHDFPEDNARKVFINVQMSAGDEDDNEEIKSSQSSGDESMIYLEFLEAVAAVACYKYVNPYTPLSTRLETFFKEQLLEVGLKVIKQRKR